MTTMTYFNMLHYVKKLEASGIPPAQAEAMVEAQQDAFSECVDNTLAKKSDIKEAIAEVKRDIAKVEHDVAELRIEVRTGFKWMQWAISILAAGVGALVLKAFF